MLMPICGFVSVVILSHSCTVAVHKGMGFMPSCTTSWTSASSLFPVCHYWSNWI